MRRSLCGAIGLVAVGLLTLTAAPSNAATPEHGLLGIKLFNKYSDVLRKYGQPNRIEIGAATGGVSDGGGMAGPGGGGMISGPAMGGSMAGAASMPGGGTSKMAAMMGGGGPGMGGLPGMGGMGMGSGSGSAGMMARMMRGGGGMDLPGGGPGGDLGGGMSLSGGPGSAGTQSSGSDGEITWVYNRGSITDFFLFNKDGRVIQIQSFGYKGGNAVTAAGVRLGDQVSKLYQNYGWTSNLTQSGTNMTMDFSKERQAAFQLADLKDGRGYRVVGITVGVADNNVIHSIGAPAGGGMMDGMGGGMPGMGSGSGMMQQMMRGGGKPRMGGAGMAK
jgi:hypothetical protein